MIQLKKGSEGRKEEDGLQCQKRETKYSQKSRGMYFPSSSSAVTFTADLSFAFPESLLWHCTAARQLTEGGSCSLCRLHIPVLAQCSPSAVAPSKCTDTQSLILANLVCVDSAPSRETGLSFPSVPLTDLQQWAWYSAQRPPGLWFSLLSHLGLWSYSISGFCSCLGCESQSAATSLAQIIIACPWDFCQHFQTHFFAFSLALLQRLPATREIFVKENVICLSPTSKLSWST